MTIEHTHRTRSSPARSALRREPRVRCRALSLSVCACESRDGLRRTPRSQHAGCVKTRASEVRKKPRDDPSLRVSRSCNVVMHLTWSSDPGRERECVCVAEQSRTEQNRSERNTVERRAERRIEQNRSGCGCETNHRETARGLTPGSQRRTGLPVCI